MHTCAAGHDSTAMFETQSSTTGDETLTVYACATCGREIEDHYYSPHHRRWVVEKRPSRYDHQREQELYSLAPEVRECDVVIECAREHARLRMVGLAYIVPIGSGRWYKCSQCGRRQLYVLDDLLDEADGVKREQQLKEDMERRLRDLK